MGSPALEPVIGLAMANNSLGDRMVFCMFAICAVWAFWKWWVARTEARPSAQGAGTRSLYRFLEASYDWFFGCAACLIACAICCVAGLAALALGLYGAWRGIAMFLTLAPVSILAGLVLFLVSALLGCWVVLACVAGALVSWDKMPSFVETKPPGSPENNSPSQ